MCASEIENSDEHGAKPKRAVAPKQNTPLCEISPPESHSEDESKSLTGAHRESLATSIRVKLPCDSSDDVEQIVQYLDLWHSMADFIRDAIRNQRDRRIDDMRRTKEELEKSDSNPQPSFLRRTLQNE